MVHTRQSTLFSHHLPLELLLLLLQLLCQYNEAYKIAIIGGGISGSFTAKYLAEYDAHHRSTNNNSDDENDHNVNNRGCLLDEIIVYDVSPPTAFSNDESSSSSSSSSSSNKALSSSSDPRPSNWQGSRVSSITLDDGSVVELGASIIYEGNRLVVDMMENGDGDGTKRRLVRSKPMSTGNQQNQPQQQQRQGEEMKITKPPPSGMGIYHGNKQWLLKPSPFYTYPKFLKSILEPLYFLWRYNFDYFRLNGAVNKAVTSFDLVYDLLNDTEHEVTYFASPIEMWEAMGLHRLSSISFHDLLDGLGMYRDTSLELNSNDNINYQNNHWWSLENFNWRKYIPGMGCLRAELVSAIALNTYNQDLNQMNGLVGLVAYVPVGGKLFSVEGGNYQLMEVALEQSNAVYDNSTCASQQQQQRVQRRTKQITTVVASENYMTLYSNQESLGKFDIVILAAPIQQCRIQFLVESPMGLDKSVLHEMPLGGTVENRDAEEDDMLYYGASSNEDNGVVANNNEHGQHLFASSLPPSATLPYTSVITTVVSNATLNASHFGLRENDTLPRSILVSERGKSLEGITTLTILSIEKGLMKTFSSKVLDVEKRDAMFGVHHVVEYVQVWGNGGGENGKSYGGATPSFEGGRHSKSSLPYLLYDGSEHWGKGNNNPQSSSFGKNNNNGGPALYYVNAIESAVAAIEISAIGAKSVSKLVACRLGLIRPKEDRGAGHDEL